MRTLAPAVLCCLVFSTPAPADRAEIEKTLGEMQHAAATANMEAYLSHVSRADPIFHMEQVNWAKDLKRIKPTQVEFAIGKPGEGQTEEFAEKRARFEMVINWTLAPEKPDGKALDRSVSFPVVFTRAETGAWLFEGEEWLVIEGGGEQGSAAAAKPGNAEKTEKAGGAGGAERVGEGRRGEDSGPRPRSVRFQGAGPGDGAPVVIAGTPAPAADGSPMIQRRCRVKYLPGFEDVARRVVEVLPEVRDHVDEGFGQRVPRVQEVKIYPTMRHLQASIYLSYTNGLSGWNEPHESIKLLLRPNSSRGSLIRLLAHEYGHVATFEYGDKANDMPWWVIEGVAELSNERYVGAGLGREAENAVLRWAKTDKIAKWEDLTDFHIVPGNLQGHVYKQGHHMLGFISDQHGQAGRNAWLRAMAKGRTLDQACTDALGMTFAELDAQWRAEVTRLVEKAALAEKAKKDAEAKAGDAAPANN